MLIASILAVTIQQSSGRWTEPFEILPTPASAALYESRLRENDSAVWQEGDVLTILHRNAASEVTVTGGIQKPMGRIPGSDLWILRLKMDGWEGAIIRYGFFSPEDFFPGLRVQFETWRGADAPELPHVSDELKGTIVERTFRSDALGEDRDLTIYLPPDPPKKGLPAFFMADGQACEAYAKVLEPLILSGKVRPVAIVGVHHGGYRGDRSKGVDRNLDFRAKEYVPGFTPDWFDRHMVFFAQEVTAYVEREFAVSSRREDRAVFGGSNGGSFSAAVSFRHPETFGAAIPMSLGVPPTDEKPNRSLPRMFFIAGSLESFSVNTSALHEALKKCGAQTNLDIYVAGHDSIMWKIGFVAVAPQIFPGDTPIP